MLNEDIALIQELCRRLCSAHLLVLDKEISLFLSAAADNSAIASIIAECSKNYYFDTDWQRFLAQKRFAMAIGKRQIVAFVFGLLYKFDINEISSVNTLSSFYPALNDLQKAYHEFCLEVITPMRDALIALLKGEPTSDDEITAAPRGFDKMNEDVDEWIAALLVKIRAGGFPDNGERELTVMLRALQELLAGNLMSLLKPYWAGLKSTFAKYRLNCREIDEIEKLFKLYGLDVEI